MSKGLTLEHLDDTTVKVTVPFDVLVEMSTKEMGKEMGDAVIDALKGTAFENAEGCSITQYFDPDYLRYIYIFKIEPVVHEITEVV